MLPKEWRIQNKNDIAKVAQNSRATFSGYINIKKLKNNKKHSRFLVVISNQITKKAVLRNKIRRQILGIIQKNITDIKSSFDILIICKKGITELPRNQLKQELQTVFKKAKLLK